MSILEPAQLRQFVDAVRDDRLRAAWVLAATTGMRRGEILGLRWSDLDLEAKTLRVAQIRTVAHYKVVTLSPKTEKGARTIAIDAKTVAALKSHRRQQQEERMLFGADYMADDGDLVFRREQGEPIHPERFSSWFKQHCRRAGLPPVRFHDIRTPTSRRCCAPASHSKPSVNVSATPPRWSRSPSTNRCCQATTAPPPTSEPTSSSAPA